MTPEELLDAELEEIFDDPDADLDAETDPLPGTNSDQHPGTNSDPPPSTANQPFTQQLRPPGTESLSELEFQQLVDSLQDTSTLPPTDLHAIPAEGEGVQNDPIVIDVVVPTKKAPFRFPIVELVEMIPLLKFYRVAAKEDKIEEFMTLASTRFFTVFPHHNKPTPDYKKTRTKLNKISRARLEGVEIPYRTVSASHTVHPVQGYQKCSA